MRPYDVLVVGGGPSGLTAARILAERGYEVGVLEEHAQVGNPVNCSGVLGAEAFERFNIPSGLIRHSLSRVQFLSPGGRRFYFGANRALAHVVLRSELDGLLGRRAERAGVDLFVEHRATAIDRHEDGVDVSVCVGRDKRPMRLSARAIVLSTGGGMPLLKKIRMDGFPERLLGVQAEVTMDARDVEVVFGRAWAPEGFAWIVPTGDDTAKLGLLCDRDGPQTLRRFLDRPDVRDRVRAISGPIRCSVLPIGFLERSFDDRLLVIGEAAGQIKPTTCGGIYYGMLAAEIAADTLDVGLREDRLGSDVLSDYETRWRSMLAPEIDAGLRLRKSFKLMGDWGIERLFSLAQTDGVVELIEKHADFDWHRKLIAAVFRDTAVGRVLGMGLVDLERSSSPSRVAHRGVRELSTV